MIVKAFLGTRSQPHHSPFLPLVSTQHGIHDYHGAVVRAHTRAPPPTHSSQQRLIFMGQQLEEQKTVQVGNGFAISNLFS